MIRRENYYSVHGWMIFDLNLRDTELLVYSIIYGFSQDGCSKFCGSLKYLMVWAGNKSKQCIINALKNLEEKNLIIKEISSPTNKYSVNMDYVDGKKSLPEDEDGGKKSLPAGKINLPEQVKKVDQTGKINLPNNIDNNKDNIIDIEYDEDGFSSPVLAASSQKNIETNAPSAKQVKEPAYYKCRPTPPEGITDDTTPYSTEKYPYVFLSRNDRGFLRWKYDKCYIPTLHALNEWNKLNPEFKYSSNKDGFERFVAKQGLRRPREDGLSEGSVIARI